MALEQAYNGLLILNKPLEMTSHTAVNRVRRLLNMKRVGHAGTLDPLATGILVVMVGPATRLSQFLMEKDKRYTATIFLGSSTTTYDAEGEITAQHPISDISLNDIQQALSHLVGAIEQVPPMYSAIKINGQKLYKLARQGKEIERPARPVTLHQIDIIGWDEPHLQIDVVCSAGTYIRSLAHDVGQVLGCGGYLDALERTASGQFTLEHAYTFDQLDALKTQDALAKAILPPVTALNTYPRLVLNDVQIAAVRHGQTITTEPCPVDFAAGMDSDDNLIAVLIPDDKHPGRIRPKIVFPPVER